MTITEILQAQTQLDQGRCCAGVFINLLKPLLSQYTTKT